MNWVWHLAKFSFYYSVYYQDLHWISYKELNSSKYQTNWTANKVSNVRTVLFQTIIPTQSLSLKEYLPETLYLTWPPRCYQEEQLASVFTILSLLPRQHFTWGHVQRKMPQLNCGTWLDASWRTGLGWTDWFYGNRANIL